MERALLDAVIHFLPRSILAPLQGWTFRIANLGRCPRLSTDAPLALPEKAAAKAHDSLLDAVIHFLCRSILAPFQGWTFLVAHLGRCPRLSTDAPLALPEKPDAKVHDSLLARSLRSGGPARCATAPIISL